MDKKKMDKKKMGEENQKDEDKLLSFRDAFLESVSLTLSMEKDLFFENGEKITKESVKKRFTPEMEDFGLDTFNSLIGVFNKMRHDNMHVQHCLRWYNSTTQINMTEQDIKQIQQELSYMLSHTQSEQEIFLIMTIQRAVFYDIFHLLVNKESTEVSHTLLNQLLDFQPD